MNMMMFSLFKLLGQREKAGFGPHNLNDLVTQISTHEGQYPDKVQNIKNYLSHLNIQQIVTPVRKISEFIEEDLLQADPHFFGTIVTQIGKVDQEHKKVTNSPEKGKTAWLKIILIMCILIVIVFAIYWIMDSGVISNALPKFDLGSLSGSYSGPPGTELTAKYPTPESLKAAIDRGEISEDALTPTMKDMLKNYEPPTVTPTP